LHRIEKWVSVLDIRELGEKLIKQLFDKGRVRDVADLYTLEAAELAALERMGELSAAKVVRNIRSGKPISLAAFVAGFDIEGLGETLLDLVAASGYDTLEKLRGATEEELAAIYSFGAERAKVLVQGLKETRGVMDAVLASPHVKIAAPRQDKTDLPLAGLSFCFTGELSSMKRPDAEAKVKSLGGTSKSSVVKGLSYLVTNTPESGSAKNKKAGGLGVPIIDEKAFLAMLE
jgi:DNA ligase (NAD+)